VSGPCTDCGGPDYQTLLARIAELKAENERLKANWAGLRREVVAYEKSGIDLYQRENGMAFRKMMDRWAERGAL